MKKFIIKIFLNLAIFLVLGNLVAFACQYFLGKSQFYKPNFVVNALDQESIYDYFMVGSSRGLTTIDSKQIDKEINTNGINLSMADTDLKTQVLMVKHFYAEGYSAKNCILILDKQHYTKTYQELGGNDYRFVAYSGRDYVNEHYNAYEDGIVRPLTISNFLPLAAYSYYNLELFMPSGLAGLKPNFRNKFDERGNYAYPNQNLTSPAATRSSYTATITNPLVKEIEELTAANNTRLIIYIAPYINETQQVDLGTIDAKLINHSNKFVGKDELYHDGLHVTEIGRTAATEFFIPDLKPVLKK